MLDYKQLIKIMHTWTNKTCPADRVIFRGRRIIWSTTRWTLSLAMTNTREMTSMWPSQAEWVRQCPKSGPVWRRWIR